MNRCLCSRIFNISFLVILYIQNTLFSENPEIKQDGMETATSEQIWDIAGVNPNISRENIQNVLQRNHSTAAIVDLHEGNASDEAEWKKGWDIDYKEEGDGDIETFFPMAKEERQDTTINLFNVNPPKSSMKSQRGGNSHRHSEFLLPIEADHEVESTKPLSERAASQHTPERLSDDYPQFVDFNDEKWSMDPAELKQSGDISTAKMSNFSIVHSSESNSHSSVQEKDGGNALAIKDDADTVKSKEDPRRTPSLVKKSVAVDLYITPIGQPPQKTTHRQTISATKAPYFKSSTQSSQHGVLGPTSHTEQNSSTSTQEDSGHREVQRSNQATHQRSKSEEIVAQLDEEPDALPTVTGKRKTPPKTILINFNNVSIIEYIRFISRITSKNFVFDEADLQFNVTIISEEPTTAENIMTALIQELRIHGLSLIEQDNNLIIHKNPEVNSISRVNVEGIPSTSPRDSEIVTQVFRLNTLDPGKARNIIRPLLSSRALIEISEETRQIIVTDIVTNISQITLLFKSIDAPNSGLVIGQYVVRNAFMDTLIELARQIMKPIAQDQPLTFVPHPAAKSIFVVSSPFLVERTISVLHHLDTFRGTTKIYDLEELRYEKIVPPVTPPGVAPRLPEGVIIPPSEPMVRSGGPPTSEGIGTPDGKWEITPKGDFIFRPGFHPDAVVSPRVLPQGRWEIDPQDNWYFVPEGIEAPFIRREAVPDQEERLARPPLRPGERPDGRWALDREGNWVFELAPEEALKPQRFTRAAKLEKELPLGHIERIKFYIHKLEYRKGEDIVTALQQIGDSLQQVGTVNADLILTIQSTQWLEAPNFLVFTGTKASIEKVKQLVGEIDRPLRQVLIEMLILETSIDDSLTYGVSWATRSGGGNTSTAQAFLGGASPLVGALDGAGIGDGEVLPPVAATLATTLGYNLGIIGQRITHNGTQFATLGALVTALHQRSDTNIVMNPKIITEDNKPAEIFVGINTRFQTQAVSNDEGSIITNNFEFRDVGTTLKVTPLIGNSDIITLEIEQEVSRVTQTGGGQQEGETVSDISPGPTTSINRTLTTVHIPDRHFVIISGMIQTEKVRTRNQLPCLGGIPILGAAFSTKTTTDTKRNLMIFIRPQIIDTEEQMRTVTRQQQEILKQKNRMEKGWKYEVDEALDFLNIKSSNCDVCD